MNAISTVSSFRVGHLWIWMTTLGILLFVVGSLISRSLVEFSKFFCILISVGYFWLLCKYPISPHTGKKTTRYFIAILMSFSIGLTLYVLGWVIDYLDWELLVYLLLGQVWSLAIVLTSWKRGLFSDEEVLYWWFFNGLLWWFIVSFAFRDLRPDIDLDAVRTHFEISRHQLRGVLNLAFSFTLPFTMFYFFFKMISADKTVVSGETLHKSLAKPMKAIGIAAIVSLVTLTLMGLPSLLSLGHDWENWEAISKSLGLSYNAGRLSSFHFVLDLSNIIAQGFFITLAWVLSHSLPVFNKAGTTQGRREAPNSLAWRKFLLGLGLCFFLLTMFFFTWTKLLIPLVLVLLLIFLTVVLVVFKKNNRYLIAFPVGLGLLVGIFLTTENKLNSLFKDLVEVGKAFENHWNSNTPSLVGDIMEADPTFNVSLVYRLQHYTWGWRILLIDPLTGIGPYGYTDYVVDHFPEDLLPLPYIILSKTPANKEAKKALIAEKTTISRSLLGTHADWVMIVSSGGIPGMIFYYGLFGVLIGFFVRRYVREKELIYLGITFALLAMLASGITEPNFKTVHFHLLSIYTLIFMGMKFFGQGVRYR